MREYDVVIVGAGPAGSAAGIQISNLDTAVARRTLVLEKGVFPRHKLCGGGLTTHADALLKQLQVTLDVPAFPIHALRFVYGDRSFTFPWRNIFRVVRREEFDAALARCAQARGLELHEGEALSHWERDECGVTVYTSRSAYRAQLLIGADGANSVVRQQLGLVRSDRIARLMEILTPVDAAATPEFVRHTAVFDFTPLARGVQGYYWDFPSLKQGVATMNRGMFDSRVHPARSCGSLRPIFEERLARRGVALNDVHWQGHPERWFDAAVKHSAPRVLLAGDAAGTEPLLGEGISHALDFGRLAANAALRAIARDDFQFAGYERRVAWSALGRRLRGKRAVANLVYQDWPDWLVRMGFGILESVFPNPKSM